MWYESWPSFPDFPRRRDRWAKDTAWTQLLLVEDEHLLRTLVSQFLRGEGFEVVEAADGPEGVDRFLDSGPFDLVLLDLNLPVFSGVEVCRRIRRLRAPNQRMMITCNGRSSTDHERDLERSRIHHFLTKPYHP